jgi:hypothetical protein
MASRSATFFGEEKVRAGEGETMSTYFPRLHH